MKQTIVKLIDDIDGGGADQTVEFGIDGVMYTIDLSDENAASLRDVFSPYIAGGQSLGRTTARVVTRSPGTRPSTGVDTRSAREWLKANGYLVPDRGRLRPELMEAFQARRPARTVPYSEQEAAEATAAVSSVPAVGFSSPEPEQPQVKPRRGTNRKVETVPDAPAATVGGQVKVSPAKKASPRKAASK